MSPTHVCRILLATLGSVMLFTTPSLGATLDVVRIGIVVDQTGSNAAIGKDQAAAAWIAGLFFHAQGGVAGKIPLQLIIENARGYRDDASRESEEVKESYRRLIDQGVVAIVGPSTSRQAQDTNYILNEKGVVIIGPSNTARRIPRIGPYSFRVSAGVEKHAKYALQALRQHYKIRTILIAYDDRDAYSQSEKDAYAQLLLEKNVRGQCSLQTAVAVCPFTDMTTIDAYAADIVRQNPDLVIISSLPPAGSILIQALRGKGYTKEILGGNGLNAEKMITDCGQPCHGLLLSHAYNPNAQTSKNQEFRKAVANSQLIPPGTNPSQFMAQAFTAIQVLVEALSDLEQEKPLADRIQEGGLSTLCTALKDRLLKDRLLNISSFETPLGTIQFTQVDDEGDTIKGGDIKEDPNAFYLARVCRTGDKWRMQPFESCKSWTHR